MTIHKEFINQIIKQYNTTLGDLVGNSGLNITKNMKSVDELPDQLDRIFYTLDFLEKEELIKVEKTSNNINIDILELPFGADTGKIPGIIFYEDKLKQTYGWNIEMKPGLIHFKEQRYKTDNQLKENRQFWLAISVAVLASFLSALFMTYFPKIF